MSEILIIYYSRTGNTEKMAEEVKKGAEAAGAKVKLLDVKETEPDDMLSADGIIIGSPTYYGLPAAEVKDFIDRSVKYHGDLEDKIGGAFASAGNTGGGNETTVLSIIEAMLIHGMIIKGTSKGDHYGPVSIGDPDKRVKKQCRDLGERVAKLADML